MSCCGILCHCNDITKCVGCEFYDYATICLSCALHCISETEYVKECSKYDNTSVPEDKEDR